MAGGKGTSDEPTAPGWYPDPWSATGEGERYFDGKRWGTSEKPLGRHTVATLEGRPPKSDRFRRVFVPVAILVFLVGAVWAVPKFLNQDDSSSDTNAAPRRAVERNAPPPSTEESERPIGTPAPVPAGTGKFELMEHQPGDAVTPVAFDPCRPIHYVVNPAGAPSDGLTMIQDSVARVSAATGLEFIDDGTSAESPNKEREPFQATRYGKTRWAPVLISWADEASFPALAGYVAGVGSPQAVYAPSLRLVYVTGQIVLDAQQLAPALTPDRGEAKATILHEFGHLAGLDHTNDRTQIMFSESQFNVQDYGDGDLRGLALLGTQACFPKV